MSTLDLTREQMVRVLTDAEAAELIPDALRRRYDDPGAAFCVTADGTVVVDGGALGARSVIEMNAPRLKRRALAFAPEIRALDLLA